MLKYCNFDDGDARYFANIFWYNDKIRHLSLADNEKITAFGIKTLLNIKEYNKVLQELLVHLPNQYKNRIEFYSIENTSDKFRISNNNGINIFDKEAINAYLKKLQEKNLDYTIESKNLRVNTTRSALEEKVHKNAGILFRLITESYNEIIGRGNLDKVLMLFGLEEVGKTVIGCQLSNSTDAEKFTVTELNKLKPIDSEYYKKIRHSQIIDNNPNNQSNQNNPVNPDNTNKEDDYKRFNKTMKQEFFDTAMRKKIYTDLDDLQLDLDIWLEHFNNERPHSGKYYYGKTPMQTFKDSKKLAIEKNNEILYLEYSSDSHNLSDIQI